MPATPDWPAARYLAWLYSPPPQRPLVEALFDIEREIASSVRPGLDHQVAHARLQWWREECQRCAAGRPVHPLTQALLTAATRGPCTLPLDGLSGLVDTATWDLAGATFESRRELAAYCARWAGAITQPMALQATAAAVDWQSAGASLRELELLVHVAQEAHQGRLRLPLDELQLAGVEPGNLAHPPWAPALGKLLSERHVTLRSALARAIGQIAAAEQPTLRGLLVWARLVARESVRAQQALPGIPRPRRLEVLANTWRAWYTARRATRGRLRSE